MENSNLIIEPKKPKGEDGNRVFSIRVREETVKKIEILSSKTGHSRNAIIGLLLEYAVERCTIAKKSNEK